MMTDILVKAKKILNDNQCTLVLISGEKILQSHDRGVKPLLELLDANDDLEGACAADKVIGKAAAILYVLLGVKEVYASVISEGAKEILMQNGITVCFDSCVKAIINRSGIGLCPMEQAVGEEKNPYAALILIREKLKAIASN